MNLGAGFGLSGGVKTTQRARKYGVAGSERVVIE